MKTALPSLVSSLPKEQFELALHELCIFMTAVCTAVGSLSCSRQIRFSRHNISCVVISSMMLASSFRAIAGIVFQSYCTFVIHDMHMY